MEGNRALLSAPGPLRVGTDLVSVRDVAHSIATFGDRYLRRVYSPGELAQCVDADGRPDAPRLAARFAAKEAVIKALRPSRGVDYAQLEVVTDPSGAPAMRCLGSLADWPAELALDGAAISLTHDGDVAGATFVALAALTFDRTPALTLDLDPTTSPRPGDHS